MSPLAGRTQAVPPMVSLWTPYWGILDANCGPSSGAWETSNRGIYVPIQVLTACPVRKMWWANGASVSSAYVFEAGIYTDANHRPGTRLCSTQALQGTANEVQFRGFDATAGVRTNGNSNSDATSYATASVTLKAGYLYILAFTNSHATSAPEATTVQTTTGGTVSFTSRQSVQLSEAGRRLSAWTAVPTSDVTDTITISFSDTQTGCAWVLLECRNVDTATNHGIVQGTTDTQYGTAPSVTLSALGDSRNATIGIISTDATGGITPGSGYFELYEQGTTTPGSRMAVELKTTGSTTVDASISETDYGIIGLELKSAKSTYVLPPALYWLYLHGTSASSTVFRYSGSTYAGQTAKFQQSSLDTGLSPLTATPAEAVAGNLPLFGFATSTIY